MFSAEATLAESRKQISEQNAVNVETQGVQWLANDGCHWPLGCEYTRPSKRTNTLTRLRSSDRLELCGLSPTSPSSMVTRPIPPIFEVSASASTHQSGSFTLLMEEKARTPSFAPCSSVVRSLSACHSFPSSSLTVRSVQRSNAAKESRGKSTGWWTV